MPPAAGQKERSLLGTPQTPAGRLRPLIALGHPLGASGAKLTVQLCGAGATCTGLLPGRLYRKIPFQESCNQLYAMIYTLISYA